MQSPLCPKMYSSSTFLSVFLYVCYLELWFGVDEEVESRCDAGVERLAEVLPLDVLPVYAEALPDAVVDVGQQHPPQDRLRLVKFGFVHLQKSSEIY